MLFSLAAQIVQPFGSNKALESRVWVKDPTKEVWDVKPDCYFTPQSHATGQVGSEVDLSYA